MLTERPVDTGKRQWGEQEAERYLRSRHGPDGKKFLDPYISAFLDDSRDKGPLLDVGTGTGTVAIEAVRDHGVSFVFGIDKFPAMIDRAQKAIEDAGLTDNIVAEVADAQSLPCEAGSYRRAISVNVGCNLDNDVLAAHLKEMRRVITFSGQILFTVPINLGVLFSNGNIETLRRRLLSSSEEIKREGVSQEAVQQHLGGIEELHRGTFVAREGNLRLVVAQMADLSSDLQFFAIEQHRLQEADAIWRKLPGLVVPNNYHSEAYYEQQIHATGLKISAKQIGHFVSELERNRYNESVSSDEAGQRLGAEYVGQGPFAVYILSKH